MSKLKRGLTPVSALICAAIAMADPHASIRAAENSTPAASQNSQTEVPCVIWKNPTKESRAAILCIHGLSLHKNTYQQLGKKLADQGIVTYAIDVRGFGDWVKRNQKQLDFEASLADIQTMLQRIHRDLPGVPVFLLGESMGGGLAVQATALNPELIDGLISSCPASERYHQTSTNVKVALHAIVSGMNSPWKLNKIVDQATEKAELKKEWQNDPAARMSLSPADLRQFQQTMEKSVDAAAQISKTPVLFVQGSIDKLVRPAGTYRIYNHIASPVKMNVISKSSEHLIFEENQFSNEDLQFVLKWLDKYIAAKNAATNVAVATKAADTASTQSSADAATKQQPVKLDYWIELHRGNSTYRCTNKSTFKSGDKISFHVIPHDSGYAYIMLTTGSSGGQAILFPSIDTGLDNHLIKDKDYTLPTKTPLLFDRTPGTERVSLVFSKLPIDAQSYMKRIRSEQNMIAYVSTDTSGAKDLVPTRMKLSWDDDASQLISPDEAASDANHRLVRLSDYGGTGVLAVDIALEHQ